MLQLRRVSPTFRLYAGMRWSGQGNPLPRVLRKALRAERFRIRPQADSRLDGRRSCALIVSSSMIGMISLKHQTRIGLTPKECVRFEETRDHRVHIC
jgi:hypothetical protein